MPLKVSAWLERMRANLFFVPMLAVLVSVASGFATLALDRHLDTSGKELPFGLTSTVDSARALLSTIAGATITFAGIAFSVSLLIIQLASSQYSPRVVHTLFRDPYNKRVMALVVGTFTYCIIVLRSVRSPLERSGDAVIPNVSVSVAVVLGIATILAIVAFINHSAHAMDVSEILERVRHEAVAHVQREWSLSGTDEPAADEERVWPTMAAEAAASGVIRFDRTGWFQQFDADALLDCVPKGGVMRLETGPGRYAIAGTPLCTITPEPDDLAATARQVCAAVGIGATRTMQQDVSYGLRQLADIALKALSPGINDPTTAQDAIFHTAAVLAEILQRDPPPRHRTDGGGRHLLIDEQPTHDELVELAFDETRRAAANQPTVSVYLLEALHLLHEPLAALRVADRRNALTRQAQLVVDGCSAVGLLPSDFAVVREAHAKRFGP